MPDRSGGNTGAGQPLVADDNGRVDRSTTGATGIQGRWFASADTEDCRKKGGHAVGECSRFVAPEPNAPNALAFRPTGDLGMCTAGVAAKAIARPDGNPDWQNIWGARIGLTLDDGGPYDARAHGVTGFGFHIDSEPPPNTGVRVQLSTATASKDPALWQGGTTVDTSPVHAGRNELRWRDVGGPPYVDDPPAFDPARLLSIVFMVPTNAAAAKSFGFCISRLVALTN